MLIHIIIFSHNICIYMVNSSQACQLVVTLIWIIHYARQIAEACCRGQHRLSACPSIRTLPTALDMDITVIQYYLYMIFTMISPNMKQILSIMAWPCQCPHPLWIGIFYTVRSRYIAVIFRMRCRSWVQIWPLFYHFNWCDVHIIASYITAMYRESILSCYVSMYCLTNPVAYPSRWQHGDMFTVHAWRMKIYLASGYYTGVQGMFTIYAVRFPCGRELGRFHRYRHKIWRIRVYD